MILHRPVLNLLLLAGLTLGSCAVQPPPAAPPIRPLLVLQPCKLNLKGVGIFIDARCGQLAVDEDYSHPGGRKIDLNIAVIPAVDRKPQPDPVFLIAGGPGEAAAQSFPLLMDALSRLNQGRDLVMVDQRGTGDSHPLTCPQDEDPHPNFDLSAEQSLEQLKTCRQKLASDPRFYTTAAAVLDLEQVRQALGYPRVNLLGVSYGTRVALAYLRQSGEVVRSVILDSVASPSWELGPHNAANAQRAFDLLLQRCAAASSCARAYPDLNHELNSLLAQLDQKPVKVSLRHPINGQKIEVTLDRGKLGYALEILSYEPETAALIPLLVHSAYQDGSYDLLLAQTINSQSSLSAALSTGVYYSVLCAEDVPFYPAVPENTPSYLQDTTMEMASQCKVWNVPAAPPAFKQPVRSDRPVLLLSGEADPVTPPVNAAEAARSLSNSLAVTVPGMGHAVFTRGCVPRLLADFIAAGSVRGLDTSCVQQISPQPFFLNFSGTQP